MYVWIAELQGEKVRIRLKERGTATTLGPAENAVGVVPHSQPRSPLYPGGELEI